MEVFALFAVVFAWALTALMAVAVASDLLRLATRRRGGIVLVVAGLLSFTAALADVLARSAGPLQGVFLMSVVFGGAAMLVYAIVLLGSLFSRCMRRRGSRSDIAV